MMDFRPGDIAFVMDYGSWISRTIAWFMNSRWSHTALVFDVSDHYVFTTETNVFCVKHGTIEKYLSDHNFGIEVWSPINLSDVERRSICDESLKWVDRAYGWLQLFSLGVRRLLMRVGIRIRNFIRQGLVCDHVILYSYKASSIRELGSIDPESIDTEELYQIVKSCGKFEMVFKKMRGEAC